MAPPQVFTRFGVLDTQSQTAVIYAANSKYRLASVAEKEGELEFMGVITGTRDCVVTATYAPGEPVEVDGAVKGIGIVNNDVRTFNVSRRAHEAVTKPSECIETAMRNTASAFKFDYASSILFEPHRLNDRSAKMSAIAQLSSVPLSTVGVRMRIKSPEGRGGGEKDVVVHNPSGVAGFNLFNSSPIYFEAHGELDVLMMMVSFLKYNSLWGEVTANMDLFKFDYAGAFFDERWTKRGDGEETSFMMVRTQLLASYFKCKAGIKKVAMAQKRRREAEGIPEADELETSTENLQLESIRGSCALTGGHKCPHDPSVYHVSLCGDERAFCIACFATIFFVPEEVCDGFVDVKHKAGIESWIQGQMRQGASAIKKSSTSEEELKDLFVRLADITQEAHGGAAITLGTCGRRWNWPAKKSSSLQEFVFYTLASALKEARRPSLPEVDTGMLYRLLSPFGKMLLLFINNTSVMTNKRDSRTPSPGGYSEGKWWDVRYAGPNLWTFQITKCCSERRKMSELACLETLQRLPLPGEEYVDSRMIFKGFCRGETQSGAGEAIADITQSVNTANLLLGNREFIVNEECKSISTLPRLGDVICSLEVTGFRPNRAQETRNSGRVTARIMRILESREGALAWRMPKHDALIVERLNHDVAVSTRAMERALASHKILFYDIETTTVNMAADDAVITSICCCLCTAGDMKRGGERSVFGLAAPDSDPAHVAAAIERLYPQKNKLNEYPEDGTECVVTDHPPDIVKIYTNEFDMLMGFSEYVQATRPMVVSGWNSRSFDDAFIFTRIVKHLSNNCAVATASTVKSVLPSSASTTREQRFALASTGLFPLTQFMDASSGFLDNSVSSDLLAGSRSQAEARFHEQRDKTMPSGQPPGSLGWFQSMVGGCCTAIRLDLMLVCAKAYRESLSEFNLNAVLAKVSKVADRLKNVKDVVDLNYHLLGFLRLRDIKDQATVHVYCCKDAYLTAVVASAISKESEIFRLCMDSGLTEAVVTANLTTPLCIGEGAMCRNMGTARADRRGVGVRRHSMATDTKGGMVSQPIVNCVPYQTIDMTSLYPMAMIHNNLCVSTFVTHQQIMDLRDRLVQIELAKPCNNAASLLDLVDKSNFTVLEYYRPIDIAVPSWRNSNDNKDAPVTRLEKLINKKMVNWEITDNAWSKNAPPNMAMRAAGLDYFPEVVCDIDIQQAAKVNDDMHIAPSSLEYMLQVLPVLALGYRHIAPQITAGQCQTAEQLLDALEEEFSAEKDEAIKKSHWTFAGSQQHDFSCSPVSDSVLSIIKRTGRKTQLFHECQRIRVLLDRIYRRVSVYDSADDYGVRLWSARLINVGMFVRTWNIKYNTLQGVIPGMQKKYRADRVVMQQNVQKFRDSDPKRAGLNSVGEKTAKLAMNSMYGCLALKAKSAELEFKSGTSSNANSIAHAGQRGGIGGGTRHATTANQITEIARCVFGNIGCALQQALPGTKQTYGDTDSVFCVHNIPGDGAEISQSESGRLVYPMDIVLKCKLAALIPLLVNSTTKGIRYVARRDAGEGVMNIAHERLAVLSLLFAKKTYHMLHFNENSAGFAAILSVCQKACQGEMVSAEDTAPIDRFVTLTHRPFSAEGFIVPHNPGLILRAANSRGGEKLLQFLTSEGVTDETSLSVWLTSSPVWIELDARTMHNLYASKIVDAEKGYWIDEITSRPLHRGSVEHDAVSQANAVFTPYKKGAFVKRGISASTKLKGLQSLFSRQLPVDMGPGERYVEAVKNHISNYASHTTDPSLMITSARVRKLDTNVTQNRPYPLALTINNHLNPSQEIGLGDKFQSVTSVSAWSIVADPSEIPAGYFNTGGVRWHAENMKGSLSCFSIKNLSVVPNTVATAYDMLHADKTAITSMIKKNADVLASAAALSGFSLRKGALSFNTGVIATNDLAMACVKMAEKNNHAFVGTQHLVEFEDGEVSYDEDDSPTKRPEQQEDAVASFGADSKNSMDEGILARILKSTSSACPGLPERQRAINLAARKSLSAYITDVMELDNRVAAQMDALINQAETIRGLCNKKRVAGSIYKSELDAMVSSVKINMADVFKTAAIKTNLHWSKCPVTVPDGRGSQDDHHVFRVALEAMSGQHKCTNTCDIACGQSLYFVLLSSLALNLENERRRLGLTTRNLSTILAERVFEGDEQMAEKAVARIIKAQEKETVKQCFPTTYNIDTDAVLFLFEPFKIPHHPVASMTADEIRQAVSILAETKTTGKIWNFSDQRFFGPIKDKDTMDEDAAMHGVEHELPFHTGLYHRPAIEIAAACLSVYLA